LNSDNSRPRFSALKRLSLLRALLPTPGNVVFTLLVAAVLLWVQTSGAFPETASSPSSSPDTMAYQGRLAGSDGNPFTGTYNMIFSLYDVAAGGSALWTETWSGGNAIQVTDGLFNVLLGSTTSIPPTLLEDNTALWLGVKVGADTEMMPRVQIGSVLFAMHSLTVPDGSISSEKLALQNDSICLGADTTFPLPGNNERVIIPGTTLSLSLDTPGNVLMWSSGMYNFSTPNVYVGTTIFIDGSEILNSASVYPDTGWHTFATFRQVELPVGTHTLDLRAYGQAAGTITYGGSQRNTCFEYIVLN
jgi:hypothetical protein